jgi:hypothetical protein
MGERKFDEMLFRRIHMAVFPIVLIVLLLPAAAPVAQTSDLNDLMTAIARNEELITQARFLVHQTSSSKARSSLEAAEKLHQFSRDLAAAGDRPLIAVRVTGQARQAILNTINIAKREARLEENALKSMERAAHRLGQARALYEEYGERDDLPVRKLLEEAAAQLQRARNNMREHLFDVALQLARASTDMSNRAIQMLKRDSLSPEDVFREIERTDIIMERVMSRDEPALRPSLDQAVRDAMNQARELQNRAKHNARSDNYRLALEQTRRAREITMRVGRGAAASMEPNGEIVARAIAFTDELLARVGEAAQESGEPRLGERLDEAARLQMLAREKFDDEQYRAAMSLTLRAREIARRALRSIERPLDAGAVRDALARTDSAIERLAARAGESGNTTALNLVERARERQRSARAALESGDLRRALALTRVARNLSRRALQELGGDETG